jgi:hypothetical protein
VNRAAVLSPEFSKDLQSASANPSNKYDLSYVCESILSGVDSFWNLSTACRKLDDTTDSKIEWGMTSSKELFKAQSSLAKKPPRSQSRRGCYPCDHLTPDLERRKSDAAQAVPGNRNDPLFVVGSQPSPTDSNR